MMTPPGIGDRRGYADQDTRSAAHAPVVADVHSRAHEQELEQCQDQRDRTDHLAQAVVRHAGDQPHADENADERGRQDEPELARVPLAPVVAEDERVGEVQHEPRQPERRLGREHQAQDGCEREPYPATHAAAEEARDKGGERSGGCQRPERGLGH
jgi:hypothetical protein